MRRKLAVGWAVLALAASLGLASCELLSGLFNEPPTVSLAITDYDGYGVSSIYTDQTVYFSADGQDPDGDSLTYTWYLNDVAQTGISGSSASYTASGVAYDQTFSVRVVVSDGEETASASGAFYVTASVTFVIENAMSYSNYISDFMSSGSTDFTYSVDWFDGGYLWGGYYVYYYWPVSPGYCYFAWYQAYDGYSYYTSDPAYLSNGTPVGMRFYGSYFEYFDPNLSDYMSAAPDALLRPRVEGDRPPEFRRAPF